MFVIIVIINNSVITLTFITYIGIKTVASITESIVILFLLLMVIIGC